MNRLWLAAALVLAASILAFWWPVALNYDTAYALVWGRALLGLQVPDYTALGAPTPHPLLTAAAMVLAVTGRDAYLLLPVAGCVAWALMLYAAMRLAAAGGSRAAGLIAGVALASSGLFVVLGVTASKDVPYVALVLAAVTLVVKSPDRRVASATLLALAGLLRPEAWALGGLHWLYVARSVDRRQRLGLLAFALTPPMVWMSSDLLITGELLHSLTYTREAGRSLARPTGLAGALRTIFEQLPATSTWPVVIGGVAAAAYGLLARRREFAVPAVVLVIAGAGVLVQGLAGLPLTGRLLAATAALLAVLFGLGISACLSAGRLGALVGLLGLVALAFAMPAQIDRMLDLRWTTRNAGQRLADLRRLVQSPAGMRLRTCPSVGLGGVVPDPVAAIPYLAHSVYRGDGRRIELRDSGAGIVRPAGAVAPAGYVLIARSSMWTLFEGPRC